MRHPSFVSVPLLVICFALGFAGGCDKGKPEADKAAVDKAAVDKAAPAKADAAKEDSKKAGPEPEPAIQAAKQFDISADKSGALARNAALLMTTDQTSEDTALRGHLAGLSHHADRLSSDETLCAHVIGLRQAAGVPPGDLASCVTHFGHEVVILGPEVFAQMAQCVKDAKDLAELDRCEAAASEAEALLHAQERGDSLSPELCEQMFGQFQKLAMDDAGEHAELIKTILDDAKPDLMTACADYGSQAEADCALAAATMEELTACNSVF